MASVVGPTMGPPGFVPRRVMPQRPVRGPMPGQVPGAPPVQYARMQGASMPAPPREEGACTNLAELFFEPEGEVKSTNWVYVGRGRGKYEVEQEYKYVGEGAGDYHKEELLVRPAGKKLRNECIWCCLASCCALITTMILLASSRASSSPAEPPQPPLPMPNVSASTVNQGPSALANATNLMAENCLEMGVDCRDISCCKDTTMRCFQKDKWWAECSHSCQPGVRESDDLQFRTPWSCQDITWQGTPEQLNEAAVTAKDDCSNEGANCKDTKCCKNPELRCYERDGGFAQCLALRSCFPGGFSLEIPGGGQHGSDPLPWSCKDLSGESTVHDKIAAVVGQMSGLVASATSATGDAFSHHVNRAVNATQGAVDHLAGHVERAANTTHRHAGNLASAAANGAGGAVGAAVGHASKVGEHVGNATASAASATASAAGNFADAALSAKDAAGHHLGNAGEHIGNATGAVMDAAGHHLGNAGEHIGNATGAVMDAAGHHLGNAGEHIGNATGAVMDAAGHHLGNAGEHISNTTGAVMDAAGHHLGNAGEHISNTTGAVMDAAGHHLANAGEHISNTTGAVMDAAGHHLGNAGERIGNTTGAAVDAAGHHLRNAGGHISNTTGAVMAASADSLGTAGGHVMNRTRHHAEATAHIVRAAGQHAVDKSKEVGRAVVSAVRDDCADAMENCKGHGCCKDPAMTCYEHNTTWAQCLTACTPGDVHQVGLPQSRTPWSCEVVEKGQADAGGAAGAGGGSPVPFRASVSAAANVYNCSLGSWNSSARTGVVQTWSSAKKAWCCEKEKVACPLFECTASIADMDEWSDDQKAWCCASENVGCDTK